MYIHIHTQLVVFVLVQFCSVVQSCLTLCDPMTYSTPGFPVHHQLLENPNIEGTCVCMCVVSNLDTSCVVYWHIHN